jgi:hypothetical protein
MTTIDSWEDLIFDFLALSCLAEFDDLFLTVFGQTQLNIFTDLDIPLKRVRKNKFLYKMVF